MHRIYLNYSILLGKTRCAFFYDPLFINIILRSKIYNTGTLYFANKPCNQLPYNFPLINCKYCSQPKQALDVKEKEKSFADEIEPESKIELTIKALKEEKKKLLEPDKFKPIEISSKSSLPLTLPSEEPQEVIIKPPKPLAIRIWEKIKHEALHYYHGFRLLGIEIKVSSGLLWQVLNGHTLTRRERKQFLRTVSDLFRLVPFLVFIIVPFMEFLLPVALKLFPNMLPSTFNQNPSQDKLQKQLKARLEMAKFLQETIKETALQYKDDAKHGTENVNSFVEFMEKVRKGDISPTNEDIIKFSRLFEDEFTLDTLNRDQLVAMCKLLQLKPIGNNYLLTFQLNTAQRSLKQDDLLIRKEGGVDNLSVTELQAACRARGMRALGLPEDRLKAQLNQWLQLHLDHDIPASLLLLSRTMILTTEEKKDAISKQAVVSPIIERLIPSAKDLITPDKALEEKTDILKKTIAALPKAAEEQARLRAAEIEGIRVDPKMMADVIKKEADAIKQEKEEKAKEHKLEEGKQKVSEPLAITDKEELIDKAGVIKDKAKTIADMPVVSKTKPKEKLEKVSPAIHTITSTPTLPPSIDEKISAAELKHIAEAVEKLTDAKINVAAKELKEAKEMVKDIKEELQEYKEDIEEAKTLVEEIKGSTEEVSESKSAIRLAKSVNKMLGKADKLVEKLETEGKKLKESGEKLLEQTTLPPDKQTPIPTSRHDATKPSSAASQSTDSGIRKHHDAQINNFIEDNMIGTSELVQAIKKSTHLPIDDARLTKLAQLFDEDKDGKVNMEHVLEAIDIIARENVNLDMKQIRDIVKMLKSEDKLEEQEKTKPEIKGS